MSKIKILDETPSNMMPEFILDLDDEQIISGPFEIFSWFAPAGLSRGLVGRVDGGFLMIKEAAEWCDENLAYRWALHSHQKRMIFGSNADMIMFKMRWL